LTDAAQRSRKALRRMAGSMAALDENVDDISGGKQVSDVKIGDRVVWTKYNIEAEIIGEIAVNGDVAIQAGAMKLTVPITQLNTAKKKKPSLLPASAGLPARRWSIKRTL